MNDLSADWLWVYDRYFAQFHFFKHILTARKKIVLQPAYA